MTYNFSNVPDEEYQVQPFTSDSIIDALHSAPRGGKSNDISLLAAADVKYSNDYAFGVAFLPVILVLVLLGWFIMLVLMRCCGSSINCTASSRNPYVVAQKKGSTVTEREKHAWKARLGKAKFYSTICALFAGGAILILVSDGLPQLNEVVNNFDSHLNSLQEVLEKGRLLVADYIPLASVASSEREEILYLSQNFCSASQENVIEVTTSDNRLVTIDYNESLQNYTAHLESLSDFLYSASIQVGQSFIDARDEAINIEDNLDRTESWWYYFTLCFFLLFLLANVYLLGHVIIGWCANEVEADPFKRVNMSFMLPFYSFLVYMNWLLSACFVYLSILSADMCYGDPDINMASVADQYELDWGSFLHQQVSYYVRGCSMEVKPEKPTAFYDNFILALNDASTAGTIFLAEFKDVTEDDLATSCSSDSNVFMNMTSNFQQILHDLDEANDSLAQALYCSNLNSIYVDLLHNTVCDPGIMAVAKVSFALLVASIFGMFLITYLITWSKDREEIQQYDEDNSFTRKRNELPQTKMIDSTNRRSNDNVSVSRPIPKNSDENATSGVRDSRLQGSGEEKPMKSSRFFGFFKKKNEQVESNEKVESAPEQSQNVLSDENATSGVRDSRLQGSGEEKPMKSSRFFGLFEKKNEQVESAPEERQNVSGPIYSFDSQVQTGDNYDEVEVQATKKSGKSRWRNK